MAETNPTAHDCVDISVHVDVIMRFGRALWRSTFDEQLGIPHGNGIRFEIEGYKRTLAKLQSTLGSDQTSFLNSTLLLLGDNGWIQLTTEFVDVRMDAFKPSRLLERCLPEAGTARKSDREYFMWRNLRREYQYVAGSEAVHIFSLLAQYINSHFRNVTLEPEPEEDPAHDAKTVRSKSQSIPYVTELSLPLSDILEKDGHSKKDAMRHRCIFLECCRIAGYISPRYSAGGIWLHAARVDSEYLLSKLFGLPTEMPGFDSLFGGGGIAFTESVSADDKAKRSGRTLLITGRCGSGKSSLALSLAAEVARKQGLAWVMPFEQHPQDCIQYLESINALSTRTDLHSINDVSRLNTIFGITNSPESGDSRNNGALVILQPGQKSLGEFLAEIVNKSEMTKRFALRVFILDPVNSISELNLRGEIVGYFEILKSLGANLILVAEDDRRQESTPVRFLENIADTVIDLSTDRRFGYAQRYIEVMKSRLQRDQRGEHPFSIKAGSGLNVFPSSASVLARIRNRRLKGIEHPTHFGWNKLDEILGVEAIFPGDMVILQGGEGMFKTQIAMLFALASDFGKRSGRRGRFRSLILPVGDNAVTIRKLQKANYIRFHRSNDGDLGLRNQCKSDDQISVVETLAGYVQPGSIFRALEDEFEKAHLNGEVIDRVIIDNVAHWEISCPFIREDEFFADTLIEFFRRHQVTSLLICNTQSAISNSTLQSSLIDASNTLIELRELEFRATRRVTARIVKTRGMTHISDAFDLAMTPTGLELAPSSKLLRVGASGEVSSVATRLYLHSENSIHDTYNESIGDSLRPVLSRNVDINSKDRTNLVRAVQLSAYSTVDELQILQLDEFQVPELLRSYPQQFLHGFPNRDWDNSRWEDIAVRLKARVFEGNKFQGSFFAVPYYDNISLLAVRKESGALEHSDKWATIADACDRWDSESKKEVCFYFQTDIEENYNCLFFEILLSLRKFEARGYLFDLIAQLEEPLAIDALLLLKRLCSRIHHLTCFAENEQSENQREERRKALNHFARTAQYGRHWFTALNQLFSDINEPSRNELIVKPLPGKVSIAGEWYLGVPAYSAAPEVGLEIIKNLTTKEEELERLHRGVGLPTKESLFPTGNGAIIQTRYFSLEVATVNEALFGGFRRSQWGFYPRISKILTFHLKAILQYESMERESIAKQLRRLIDDIRRLTN